VTATHLDRPPSDLVSLDVSRTGSLVQITATGEIDSSSAPVVREQLDTVLDGDATEITLDLSGITFLDSAGLCVLAAAYRRATGQDVRMRVLASSRAVIRPLQITGLWELLQVERVDPGPDTVVA
jgi:anti-sigma B factor antagonist